MKIGDLFSIALRNLWRRKLRTFLTVLGVIIGATSIIVMISLGLAIEKSQMDIVESLGDLRTITIYDSQFNFDGTDSKAPPLNENTINLLRQKRHVQAVYGLNETYIQGEMKIGNYSYWGGVIGVDLSYFEDFEKPLIQGRMLGPADKYAFLVPNSLRYSMWNDKTGMSADEDSNFDFLSEKFSISLGWDDPQANMRSKKLKANLVGVLDINDWNIYTSQETLDLIEAEQKKIMQDDFFEEDKKKDVYDRIEVKVDSIDNVKTLQEELQDEGYAADSMMDFSESMMEGQKIIQAVLGGIGSISFIVAAIGIANTMVMSIYERTREIGVMKVIGASVSDIRNIFLVEALLIGLSGGLIGVGLSLLISKGLNTLIGGSMDMGIDVIISYIPASLVFASLGFSALVGLASGYFPAQRATKLSAIEAIKTE